MRNQSRLRPFLVLVAIIVTACWCLPGGCSNNQPPAPLPENTPTFTVPPAPTSTFTPIPSPTKHKERCWVFEQLAMRIVMMDMLASDPMMTMYVQMPGGVPGLELPVEGDPGPWNYRVQLGEIETDSCSYQGYAERLYCFIPIPPEYHNSAQPFNLFVNLCDEPLFTHPALSVIVETTFDDIPIDTCGPPPGDSCGAEYEEWCGCKGGIYECIYFGDLVITYQPVCILP